MTLPQDLALEDQWSGLALSPDSDRMVFSVRQGGTQRLFWRQSGSPRSICNCDAMDASWGADGTIVFAGYPRANLFRTSITGEELETVTRMDTNFEPDGGRFLMLETEPKPPVRQVNLVLNWFEELKQRVPTGQ